MEVIIMEVIIMMRGKDKEKRGVTKDSTQWGVGYLHGFTNNGSISYEPNIIFHIHVFLLVIVVVS